MNEKMFIKTYLNEVVKHLPKDLACSLSETKTNNGIDLLITIPFSESRIEDLAYKLHKKEFLEYKRNKEYNEKGFPKCWFCDFVAKDYSEMELHHRSKHPQ